MDKKVLLLVNEGKDLKYKITKEVISFLEAKGVLIYSEENVCNVFKNVKLYNDEDMSFVVIIGGDGTLMMYAHKYKDKNFNIFGINAGRVGGIYDGTADNFKEKLELILKDNYFIEKRNSMKCILDFGNKKIEETSFNEMTLSRGNFTKLLHISMLINGMHNTLFYADGVIVSTATGSTAYNLSCNGPLLLPEARNFVITPLCPQSRLITSLVVNDSDLIEIDLSNMKIEEKDPQNKPVVFIDGSRRYVFDEHCKMQLTRGNCSLNMIRTDKNSSLYEPVFKVGLSSVKN